LSVKSGQIIAGQRNFSPKDFSTTQDPYLTVYLLELERQCKWKLTELVPTLHGQEHFILLWVAVWHKISLHTHSCRYYCGECDHQLASC